MSKNTDNTIAFQGVLGAYSHLACKQVYPNMDVLPCETFEDAFAAVETGRANLAMIPIENSQAGRVADIHHMLPDSDLHIIGEHFLRIHHQLLVKPGTQLDGISRVQSHIQALSQCRKFLRDRGLKPHAFADTAGAAEWVANQDDASEAAIASSLAAEIYGLEILEKDIEDAGHNTTRFVIMARDARIPQPGKVETITSFFFEVRNVPAALYKAMGGFATNGVNMIKLESYQRNGSFTATQFFAEVEGHPSDDNVKLALEELMFFSTNLKVFGVFPKHKYRYLGPER